MRLDARIFARSHKTVHQLLLDAKGVWKEAKAESIFIYSSDTNNNWRFVASRPKRPLGSIILDAGVKEKILDDANDFLNSRKWYSERGIPFRRGYLLVRLSWGRRAFPGFLTDFLAAWPTRHRENLDNPQSRRRTWARCLHHFPLPL